MTRTGGAPASPSRETSQPSRSRTRKRAAASAVTLPICVPVTKPIDASAGKPSRSQTHSRTTCSTTDADGPPATRGSRTRAPQSVATARGYPSRFRLYAPDDLLRLQLVQLLVGVAKLAQDLRAVLAQPRRRTPVDKALAFEREREGDGRLRHRLDQAQCRRLFVLGHLGDVVDRRSRDARLLELIEEVLQGLGREALLDQSGELLPMAQPVRIRGEARSGRELGKPERVAQSCEQAVVPGGDHQLSVAEAEHLVGRDQRKR